MYQKTDPKWVKADEVRYTENGFVSVTAYGETFQTCKPEWNDPFAPISGNEISDVLVQNSRGDWLRVWFYDKDIA